MNKTIQNICIRSNFTALENINYHLSPLIFNIPFKQKACNYCVQSNHLKITYDCVLIDNVSFDRRCINYVRTIIIKYTKFFLWQRFDPIILENLNRNVSKHFVYLAFNPFLFAILYELLLHKLPQLSRYENRCYFFAPFGMLHRSRHR